VRRRAARVVDREVRLHKLQQLRRLPQDSVLVQGALNVAPLSAPLRCVLRVAGLPQHPAAGGMPAFNSRGGRSASSPPGGKLNAAVRDALARSGSLVHQPHAQPGIAALSWCKPERRRAMSAPAQAVAQPPDGGRARPARQVQCGRASGITANAALPFCRSTVPSQAARTPAALSRTVLDRSARPRAALTRSALTQSALTQSALTQSALTQSARARTAPWQAVLAPTERPASSRSPFRAAGNTSPLPE